MNVFENFWLMSRVNIKFLTNLSIPSLDESDQGNVQQSNSGNRNQNGKERVCHQRPFDVGSHSVGGLRKADYFWKILWSLHFIKWKATCTHPMNLGISTGQSGYADVREMVVASQHQRWNKDSQWYRCDLAGLKFFPFQIKPLMIRSYIVGI